MYTVYITAEYQQQQQHGLRTPNEGINQIGPIWQTKYVLAVPKNLELGLNSWPCSEGYFFSERP